MSTARRRIRVLVVDDSPIMRALIQRMLSSASDIEISGLAADAFEARERILECRPDVITLDVDMPRMDGITFLQKIMAYVPTPVVILSSLTREGSEMAMTAYESGAVRVIEKPKMAGNVSGAPKSISEAGQELIAAVREAAVANVRGSRIEARAKEVLKAAAALPITDSMKAASQAFEDGVLAIASSTGGTEALKAVLGRLPADIPPTVVVQHMPSNFIDTYARHLQAACRFEVKVAVKGDPLRRGQLLLAPGDTHLEVVKRGNLLQANLHHEPPLHGVRPAADYLFRSLAKIQGLKTWGVVLTGMGKDGAAGLLEMKGMGAQTIAQDEATSVVFGMPKAAIEAGAVDLVLPLDRIPSRLIEWFARKAGKAA
ncbi:MAG: chemotaxis response regulator protein-glutamate methylesterase [Oligoflexia bacterium]|jgi:two-component system chemotaxis response regulator CheB